MENQRFPPKLSRVFPVSESPCHTEGVTRGGHQPEHNAADTMLTRAGWCLLVEQKHSLNFLWIWAVLRTLPCLHLPRHRSSQSQRNPFTSDTSDWPLNAPGTSQWIQKRPQLFQFRMGVWERLPGITVRGCRPLETGRRKKLQLHPRTHLYYWQNQSCSFRSIFKIKFPFHSLCYLSTLTPHSAEGRELN